MIETHSLRPFIGAKDFDKSREFYTCWGFEETRIDSKMSVFRLDTVHFYLQNAYVKDWINNSMLFLEIANLEEHFEATKKLELTQKFNGTKVSDIVSQPWGKEYFVHDPSGILWHVGNFKTAA